MKSLKDGRYKARAVFLQPRGRLTILVMTFEPANHRSALLRVMSVLVASVFL